METNHSRITIGPAVRPKAGAGGIPEMGSYGQEADMAFFAAVDEQASGQGSRAGGKGRSSGLSPFTVLLLILAIPVGLYFYDDSLFPSVDEIRRWLAAVGIEIENGNEEGDSPRPKAVVAPKQTPSSVVALDGAGNPINPYWTLPNRLEEVAATANRRWTSQEEESFFVGMEHRFQWQRYRTVRDVARARLVGSEVILWAALDQPKFWMRMRAAAALGDFGLETSFDVAEKALGKASDALIHRFLQRFVDNSSEGERYLLRQIIRIVDEPSRLSILQALRRHPDPLRDLYMVAGQYDPSPRIKEWVRRNAPEIEPFTYHHYRQVVLGKEPYLSPSPVRQGVSPAVPLATMPAPDGEKKGLLKIESVEIYKVGPQALETDPAKSGQVDLNGPVSSEGPAKLAPSAISGVTPVSGEQSSR